MTLDSSTGKLHWTPTILDIGHHTVTVQVADGRGSFGYVVYLKPADVDRAVKLLS